MNKHNILIYGERLGDLLAADAFVSSGFESSENAVLDQVNVAALLRAVHRAEAEILLESADSGGHLDLVRHHHEVRVDACHRVLREMRAVARDPLTLHSHPRIAGRRDPVTVDVVEAVSGEPPETVATATAGSAGSDGASPDLEEAV